MALPTMATANAMYKRLGKVYLEFYRQEPKPSLILAHGAQALSEDFQKSVALPDQQYEDSNYREGKQESGQELSATAYCNAWLADNSKKALLANVGVGTLDQALLAVLPARHQSLRLLGLSRKVLLVDEVHAYDSYMQKLLDTLLEAHARQGGSVILLSATLPQTMRENLMNAFHKGLGHEAPTLVNHDYPLVTHSSVGIAGRTEQAVDTREQVKRTVKVTRLDNEEAALERIKHVSAEGQCVCWIRNTVKNARQSFKDLLDAGLEPHRLSLFHSRFAIIDRQTIEFQTLDRFGEFSGHADRKGQVLIATQVVEQSLDLDFDVMISDLAPIDLLIQRAGRLKRHIRDAQGNRIKENSAKDQRGMPLLYVFSPAPHPNADKNWLKPDHSGTQAIYPHVGRLWLTAKHLISNEQGQFTMPSDARRLIEAVYSDDADAEIPQALLDASYEAEAKIIVQKNMANWNALKLHEGYTRNSGDWDEETRIPTRLSEEETVPVALVTLVNGQLQPYAKTCRYAWDMSTLKLPEREWKKARELIPAEIAPLIEALKAEEKALRWREVFLLLEESVVYSAQHGFML